MRKVLILSLAAIGLFGCEGSTRSLNLGARELSLQTPVEFARDWLPAGASRDGSRIAVERVDRAGHGGLQVIDSDTQRVLGELTVRSGLECPMFSADGKTVFVESDEGYVAWNYATGRSERLGFDAPSLDPGGPSLGVCGWNADRSIAISYPHSIQVGEESKSGRVVYPQKSMVLGHVVFGAGKSIEISADDMAGFDQYGSAWFGKGKTWTKVDREGKITHRRARPGSLVREQMKDRGSMHLVETKRQMAFKDAHANVSCIWLYSDRGFRGKESSPRGSAALVFTGADIREFGFMPGRQTVFIVSGLGNYLVPFQVDQRQAR